MTFLLSTVAERDRVLLKLVDFLSQLPPRAAAITELMRRSSSVDGNAVVTVGAVGPRTHYVHSSSPIYRHPLPNRYSCPFHSTTVSRTNNVKY